MQSQIALVENFVCDLEISSKPLCDVKVYENFEF